MRGFHRQIATPASWVSRDQTGGSPLPSPVNFILVFLMVAFGLVGKEVLHQLGPRFLPHVEVSLETEPKVGLKSLFWFLNVLDLMSVDE